MNLMECKSPADRWRMTSVDKPGFGTNGQPPALGAISIKPETGNRRKWAAQDELTTEVSLTRLTALG